MKISPLITIWARHINDDSRLAGGRIGFEGDGGKGTKEEIGGVGHHGAAAGSDLVAGLEIIEFAERMVDVGGGAEFLDVADQGGRRRGGPGRGPFGGRAACLEQRPESGSGMGRRQKRRPEAERCWQWSGEESVMVVELEVTGIM
jgi:hypothetical protein